VEKRVNSKKDYIQLVSDAAHREYADVEQEMTALREAKGITFKEFYQNRLWEQSVTQQHITARKILRRRQRKSDNLSLAADYLGVTKKDVNRKIKQINDKGIFKMTAFLYGRFEVYRYSDEELDEVLYKFARRRELRKSLREKLNAVDAGELTYADLDEELQALYAVFQELMPESMYETLKEKLSYSRPDLMTEEEPLRAALLDMAVTKYLLGFGDDEYVSFHFVGKTLEEKHEFITDIERMKILKTINDVNCFDYLDDKYKAYSLLKKYYRRKAIFVTSEEDYKAFNRFCFGRKKVVIKPYCDSMGRGIKPVDTKRSTREALFKELCEEYGSFIVEELIQPHDAIRTLNPDSVNTVRVITYFDGEKTIIHDTFMKVGKKGSFVDNGGAGGIFVSVDPITGKFKSNGCDENGVIYETHPDTGVPFIGYQLPDWEQARALGMELSTKVPGLKYIGWDFTYTKKKKWIIVEGNAKTQFFGQQCTTGVGMRKNFIETVNYVPAEE